MSLVCSIFIFVVRCFIRQRLGSISSGARDSYTIWGGPVPMGRRVEIHLFSRLTVLKGRTGAALFSADMLFVVHPPEGGAPVIAGHVRLEASVIEYT
jgi:hypothetical protein